MADFVIDTKPDKAAAAAAAPAGRQARKRPRKRSAKSLIAREKALAALVFSEAVDYDGDGIGLSGQLEGDAEDESRGVAAAGGSDTDDENGEPAEGEDGEEEQSGEESDGGATQSGRAAMLPAWNDDDDASLTVDVMAGASRLKKLRRDEAERRLAGREYEARLRAQFEATQPSTDWAALPKQRRARRRAAPGAGDADSSGGARGGAASDYSDDSDAVLEEEAQARLLRGAPSLFSAPSSLPASELSVKRATDLNAASASSSAVGCVGWHPNAQLALTAGLDKTVRLFRVDGQSNALVQSVHLPRMPVLSTVFSTDGSHVLACGRGRQWTSFDLNAGRAVMLPGVIGREEAGFRELLPSPDGATLGMITESGALLLLSAKTKQLIGTLHASQANARFGGCQCAAFSPDGGLLFASGGSGLVQVWDVARRCCVHSWRDSGGIRCTRLAVAPSGKMLAAGSDSGAVSLYETAAVLGGPEPKPVKEFLNVRIAFAVAPHAPAHSCVSARGGPNRRTGVWPARSMPLGYYAPASVPDDPICFPPRWSPAFARNRTGTRQPCTPYSHPPFPPNPTTPNRRSARPSPSWPSTPPPRCSPSRPSMSSSPCVWHTWLAVASSPTGQPQRRRSTTSSAPPSRHTAATSPLATTRDTRCSIGSTTTRGHDGLFTHRGV